MSLQDFRSARMEHDLLVAWLSLVGAESQAGLGKLHSSVLCIAHQAYAGGNNYHERTDHHDASLVRALQNCWPQITAEATRLSMERLDGKRKAAQDEYLRLFGELMPNNQPPPEKVGSTP